LRYVDDRGRFLGAVIVEERDAILARRKADELGVSFTAPCTTDRFDPASVPVDLIGRKLALKDIGRLVSGTKKPPAASVRRDSKRRQRVARPS
jgi:hypothetical protein